MNRHPSQFLLSFECDMVAAEEAVLAAKAEAKREAELDKIGRRAIREMERRRKVPDQKCLTRLRCVASAITAEVHTAAIPGATGRRA